MSFFIQGNDFEFSPEFKFKVVALRVLRHVTSVIRTSADLILEIANSCKSFLSSKQSPEVQQRTTELFEILISKNPDGLFYLMHQLCGSRFEAQNKIGFPTIAFERDNLDESLRPKLIYLIEYQMKMESEGKITTFTDADFDFL